MKPIYLDYAATTPVRAEVFAAMLPYLKNYFGNPSSIHTAGKKAKAGIEQARAQTANLIGALPEEIIFTSGATEADNMAVLGIARSNRKKGNHIITSKIEHHAVLDSCRALEKEGFAVTYLDVGRDGIVRVSDVQKALRPDTILVSIMHGNNEIGTLQPIKEIGRLLAKEKAIFHTDAVQTAGHIPVDVRRLRVDLLSLSGHKMYGVKGAGALYVRRGLMTEKIMFGGAQENNRRAGTENVAGIVALGKAAEIAKREGREQSRKIKLLRDYFIAEITSRIPAVQLNGHKSKRLPGNINFSFAYVDGSALLQALNAEGIYCSAGSACTAGDTSVSHVLTALRVPDYLAQGTLRLTIGRKTTKQELEYAVGFLEKKVQELRALSNTYQALHLPQ
ncbi:MAG: cysteine desulfurase family protein [bacterium]